MAALPSLRNIFEGPDCNDFFVERIFKGLATRFLSVNVGTIDFAPAVASWIFIFAVVNLTFPRVLPRLLNSWWMVVLSRYFHHI